MGELETMNHLTEELAMMSHHNLSTEELETMNLHEEELETMNHLTEELAMMSHHNHSTEELETMNPHEEELETMNLHTIEAEMATTFTASILKQLCDKE